MTTAVDVDGRVTESTRRFVAQYFPPPEWSAQLTETDDTDAPDAGTHPDWVAKASGTGDEVYTQPGTFDVSGRPQADAIWRDAAARMERSYTYDAGGRLTGVSTRLRTSGTGPWRPVVHDITYNARGQRLVVTSGDDGDATTPAPTLEARFTYDPQTFRLLRLLTTRTTDDEVLEDYRWVHDAAGNVTFQESGATDPVWYAGTVTTPHREYRYDALDRLVAATGREHASTYAGVTSFPGASGQTNTPYGAGPTAHPADGSAVVSYTQRYSYDAVGNLLELRHTHHASTPVTSVRTYAYTTTGDGSLFNNQLSGTSVGSTSYPLTHDAHGNVTSMSHLPDMGWDAFDRLQSVQTQARSQPSRPLPDGAPAHDWFYVYDGGGQRVRKVRAQLVLVDHDEDEETDDVLVAEGTLRTEERFYVGPFEVWRTYLSDGSTGQERETLHVMDDQRRVAMVETLTWDRDDTRDDDEPVSSPVSRWRYQLDDHLGTSVGELTELGAEIGWEEYHPYGTTALWSVSSTSEVSGKRYRYTGMERDDETGLQYHTARYYAGWLGRWVAADPIGVADGVNVFAYVAAGPTSRRDPSGTEGFWSGYLEGAYDGVAEKVSSGWTTATTVLQDPLGALGGAATYLYERGAVGVVEDAVSSTWNMLGDGATGLRDVAVGAAQGTYYAATGDAASATAAGYTAGRGTVETATVAAQVIPAAKAVQAVRGLATAGRVASVVAGGADDALAAGARAAAAGADDALATGARAAAAGADDTLVTGARAAAAGADDAAEASVAQGAAHASKAVGGLDDLLRFRSELGLAKGEGTLARLDVGGQSFYGINAHGQPVTMRLNAISRTHAEADAFQQAINAGASAKTATMYVDRALCKSCGTFDGVRGMVRELGLESLDVVTPTGTQVISP